MFSAIFLTAALQEEAQIYTSPWVSLTFVIRKFSGVTQNRGKQHILCLKMDPSMMKMLQYGQIPIRRMFYLLFQVINFPLLFDLHPPSHCSALISLFLVLQAGTILINVLNKSLWTIPCTKSLPKHLHTHELHLTLVQAKACVYISPVYHKQMCYYICL